MRAGTKLLILALAHGAVLVGMVARHQWTLVTGTPVVLSVRPTDQRALVQGDSVKLAYEVGRLRLDRLAGDDDLQVGGTVYVELQPGQPAWKPTAIWRKRPMATPGAVLRGRVDSVTEQVCETGEPPCRLVSVVYGIETYALSEGRGENLRQPLRDERVDVRIAVDRQGTPAIVAILVDGQPRVVEGLF